MGTSRALSGLAAGAMAGGGAFVMAAQVFPSFAPCRILYQAHVPVLDSTACLAYAWFNTGGFAFLGVGFIALIIVTLRHAARRP